MTRHAAVFFIGGASHVGKSTLAQRIGAQLGCEVLSTDGMARHPGRPYPAVRPHVAEFFSALSEETVFTLLLQHYQNIWPVVEAHARRANETGRLSVFEGSALRPEYLAQLDADRDRSVFLWASEDTLRQRLNLLSGYAEREPEYQSLVDAFWERTARDNEEIRKSATALGFRLVDVSDEAALSTLADDVIAALTVD